jgi:hypothetical protein
MRTPYDVWRQGFTLTEALGRFVGGDAWSAEHARVMAAFDRLRTDPRSPLIDRPETATRLQDLAEDWQRLARLLQQARNDLVRRLALGELFAVGFVGTTSDGGAETLQPIPPTAWQANPEVDWDASRADVGSVRYSDIRVLDGIRAMPASGWDDDDAERLDRQRRQTAAAKPPTLIP